MSPLLTRSLHPIRYRPTRSEAPPFQFILDRVRCYMPEADLELIRSACEYAIEMHRGQKRKSQRPFVVHPLKTAFLLAQMSLDDACVAAGALHDTIEDTSTTLEDLRRLFGNEVAALVDGVTNHRRLGFVDKDQRRAQGFAGTIDATRWDLRVLLIRLADRLHNMRTLDVLSEGTRVRVSRETVRLYAPLAAMLGIYWVRRGLEDLAFHYLQPEQSDLLRVLRNRALRSDLVHAYERAVELRQRLDAKGLQAVVTLRIKSLYSIHETMLTRHIGFADIHDILAFRVLVSGEADCYTALGIVHSQWIPVSERFKDYVALPKTNGYQSLHTTVLSPDNRRLEIQIRTHDMESIAERGVTAYLAGGLRRAGKADYAHVLQVITNLVRSKWRPDDPLALSRAAEMVFFAEDLVVYSPDRREFTLPKGASVLDLAYETDTETGYQCVGARVNGISQPPGYELHHGDVVEITTAGSQRPTAESLRFVKTFKAIDAIERFLGTASSES